MTYATDKHSEYVILIAFPRQQWLRERNSVLRYTYMPLLLAVNCCSWKVDSSSIYSVKYCYHICDL